MYTSVYVNDIDVCVCVYVDMLSGKLGKVESCSIPRANNKVLLKRRRRSFRNPLFEILLSVEARPMGAILHSKGLSRNIGRDPELCWLSAAIHLHQGAIFSSILSRDDLLKVSSFLD